MVDVFKLINPRNKPDDFNLLEEARRVQSKYIFLEK